MRAVSVASLQGKASFWWYHWSSTVLITSVLVQSSRSDTSPPPQRVTSTKKQTGRNSCQRRGAQILQGPLLCQPAVSCIDTQVCVLYLGAGELLRRRQERERAQTWPERRSGADHSGELIWPEWGIWVSLMARDRLKSASLHSHLSVTSRLYDVRSRCTTFCSKPQQSVSLCLLQILQTSHKYLTLRYSKPQHSNRPVTVFLSQLCRHVLE